MINESSNFRPTPNSDIRPKIDSAMKCYEEPSSSFSLFQPSRQHSLDSNTPASCAASPVNNTNGKGKGMSISSHDNNSSSDSQHRRIKSLGGVCVKRPLGKSLRLRGMSAAPPTSSNTRLPGSLNNPSFGSFSRLGRNSNQNLSFSSHSSSTRSRTSLKPSSGTLSTSSSNSSSSSTACGTPHLRANAVMQIAQRSNASTVKTVLAYLKRLTERANACSCSSSSNPPLSPDDNDATEGQELDDTFHDDDEEDDDDDMQSDSETTTSTTTTRKSIVVPTEQMAMLAQWAGADSYYRVVITKYQGIEAILNAMRAFSDSAELQAHACLALLCFNNKVELQRAGAVACIVQAIQNFPDDISVQSEGWNALFHMAPLLISKEPPSVIQTMLTLLAPAQRMYLTPTGRQSTQFLWTYLSNWMVQHGNSNNNNNDKSSKSTTTTTATTTTTSATQPLDPIASCHSSSDEMSTSSS